MLMRNGVVKGSMQAPFFEHFSKHSENAAATLEARVPNLSAVFVLSIIHFWLKNCVHTSEIGDRAISPV